MTLENGLHGNRKTKKGVSEMKFLQGDEFMLSLRDPYQKGGRFQRAAQTVQAIWGRANMGEATFEDVFRGVAVTNHGECRVAHCVKYDLTGYARLVAVVCVCGPRASHASGSSHAGPRPRCPGSSVPCSSWPGRRRSDARAPA